ncbi:MAG: hypothetical protein M1836_002870 [Candelina mexicana]|nr:MAG: hypothetical protein M1836_002870 [Candelina mexicana]
MSLPVTETDVDVQSARDKIVDADYYALFCTAQVQPEVIEDLLKQSSSTEAGNIWSLIRTPNQSGFHKPTQSPVSEFESGFIDATFDELGDFRLEHFQATAPRPRIQPNNFAILDARSLTTSQPTVLIVKWELWVEHKDLEDDIDLLEKEGWQSVRVRFKGAADFIVRVDYLPLEEHLEGGDVCDEEGVYKLLG